MWPCGGARGGGGAGVVAAWARGGVVRWGVGEVGQHGCRVGLAGDWRVLQAGSSRAAAHSLLAGGVHEGRAAASAGSLTLSCLLHSLCSR